MKDAGIFLLSGGGSALLEIASGTVPELEDVRMNRTLVTCGASIEEMNALRKTSPR